MNRRVVTAIGAVAVVGAAIVLVWSAISTSSARVNATTTGDSFFAAGTVSLMQPNSRVELLFDADGLYPGVDVVGCVEIEYTGSIPASVRLHADNRGGTGLEDYVDFTLSISDGDSCDAAAPPEVVDVVFDGRLETLWRRHPRYDDGLELRASARPQDHFAIRATATVADDNAAQGLTTNFAITVEARP